MIKALVVDAWHNGLKSPSQIDTMLAFATQCGITDIYLQVRRKADAFYNSNYESKSPDLINTDFDPLQYALDHKGSIKLHAYLTMLQLGNKGSYVNGETPFDSSWLMKDPTNCLWFDPSNYEVRTYLRNIVKDVIGNYAVDGIFLEKLRYPNRLTGSGTLDDRKLSIKSLIEDISSDIKILKPSLPITLCVRGNGVSYQYNVDSDLVDWRELQSRNVIDFATVMCFKDPGRNIEFSPWVNILDHEKEIIMIGSYKLPLTETESRSNSFSGFNIAYYSYASFSCDASDKIGDFKVVLCRL